MRIALGISYNGQAYQGWQSQPSGRTIQDRLETGLGKFAAQEISTVCAGRTDAGVHALMQGVHFDTALVRAPTSWLRGTNSFLPPDIAVQWARSMPAEFHCRANALSRRYTYVLLQSPVRPSVDAGRVGWVFQALDGEPMREAAQHLVGTHDFTSFRASACQALSPIKTIQAIHISRRGAYWRFDVEANAFLHHMVRNIMGCLIAVGQRRQAPDWIKQVLQARDRGRCAPTFPPDGLYFVGPRYAAHWDLPDCTVAMDGLP